MFRPADVLIDNITGDAACPVAFGYFAAQFLACQQATALRKAQCPFRRHDRFARQSYILTQDFLIVLAEDEVVNHLPVRRLEAVIITAFRSELKFCLIRIIKENTIPVTAHKERDALVKRVFHHTVTRFIAVPHLVRFSSAVDLAGLLPKPEEMLVTAKRFIFHLLRAFAYVSFIGIVTEEEFLIFVEYLDAHRRLVHPYAQLRGKYLIAGGLFVHMNRSHIFQFFIDHGKGSVSPLQLPVRREPDSYHGRAAKLQLQRGTVRQVKNHLTSLLRKRGTYTFCVFCPDQRRKHQTQHPHPKLISNLHTYRF